MRANEFITETVRVVSSEVWPDNSPVGIRAGKLGFGEFTGLKVAPGIFKKAIEVTPNEIERVVFKGDTKTVLLYLKDGSKHILQDVPDKLGNIAGKIEKLTTWAKKQGIFKLAEDDVKEGADFRLQI